MEITIEKNEDYQLNITDIGENGEGIGRIDGLTTFVQGAVPGDVVKAKIIKLKKQYAIGKLVEIVEASEMRREPSCQYAKECGGCQVQHIDYKSQLELKKKIVVDALTRIGKIENVQVNDVLGMETPYHYRNKGQYPIKRVDGKVCIGFYKQRTHDIVDINTCELQNPLNDKVIEILRKFIEDNKIEIYNERTKKGLLRHLIIRVAKDTNDLMVVLVANGKRIPKEDLLVKALTEMPEVKSIILNINRESGNKIVGNRNISLFGDEKIVDHIGDLAFNISPLSFFQVNPTQTEVLYNKALEYADLHGDEEVMDLYCGIGTISLFLAKSASKVYGVESVEAAIEDAIDNAETNGITNAEFYVGRAEYVVPDLYKQGINADVVVVDPPRKGCDPALLESIIEAGPKKIVYVSCKPSTLARDLKVLTEAGYSVEEVQPVDMFAWTTHVETVVKLIKK